MNLRDELIKILLDKGALALVLALVSWYLSKSIERFKSGLSWGAELLKQKLDIARQLLKAMDAVEYSSRQFLASVVGSDPSKDERMQAFLDSLERLKTNVNDAGLLFSESAFKSAKTFIKEAESLLDSVSEYEGLDPDSSEVQKELEKMRSRLDDAIQSLQEEFPKGIVATNKSGGRLMMTGEVKHSLILAAVLIGFLVIGNLISSSPHTLSVFPWLINLVAFPIVLYPAIRDISIRRYGASLTVYQGLWIGEAITRWAALLFGVFYACYSYFYFKHGRLMIAGFIMTVLITWLIGLMCSFVCAFIITKRLPSDKASPAA